LISQYNVEYHARFSVDGADRGTIFMKVTVFAADADDAKNKAFAAWHRLELKKPSELIVEEIAPPENAGQVESRPIEGPGAAR
jgi:hypothetical protein